MPAVKTFDQGLLSSIPPGMWVAISHDQEKIVGKGLTVEEALQVAEQNGEEKPYIIRVPDNNSALILSAPKLPRYTIPYTRGPIVPSPAFPGRTTTPRPVLPILLTNGPLMWSCYAIVDSGADDIVFPASFAPRIGLTFQQGAFYQFAGAGSSNQPAWFFPITLSIGTVISYQVSVGFTPALEGTGVGLLGQNGFFDRFKLEFDLRNSFFYLEAP